MIWIGSSKVIVIWVDPGDTLMAFTEGDVFTTVSARAGIAFADKINKKTSKKSQKHLRMIALPFSVNQIVIDQSL
jgi:hypothetical protein